MLDYKEFLNSIPGRHAFNYVKLEEGLIKTYPIDFLERYLTQFLSGTKISYDLKIDELRNTGSIIIYDKPDHLLIKDISGILNQNGYFISMTSFVGSSYHSEVYKEFDINSISQEIEKHNPKIVVFVFESKFDRILSDNEIPAMMLHVTETKNVAKILKVGLIPKAVHKLASHPERIYFAFEYDVAIQFRDTFARLAGKSPNDYTLLVIDNRYRKLNITLYQDPNAMSNGKPYGIYTYDNIPPNAISIYKEIEL